MVPPYTKFDRASADLNTQTSKKWFAGLFFLMPSYLHFTGI